MSVDRLRRRLAELQPGQTLAGSGLTVARKGTTPEEFHAEIIDVVDDGLGPDRDLILADLSGLNIEQPDVGVWAGMSGSPVYVNNRLVGAVAYSLNYDSDSLAGITPAEDMEKLFTGGSAQATAQPETVRLSQADRQSVASATGTSAESVSATAHALRVPFSLSAVTGSRLEWLHRQARQDGSPLLPMTGGGVRAGAVGDPGDITAGGNFAAALSYGDITAAGVGTTTMVCAGEAVAFGHPFNWDGNTTLSAHGAKAHTIVPGDFFSYKLASPTGVVGTVDQDRFAGIRAKLGAGPRTSAITSRVLSYNARDELRDADSGRTDSVDNDFVPFLSFIHNFVNIDYTIDRIGPGSSRLKWVVTGTFRGQPFELERTNRYASGYDISFGSLFEMLDNLESLNNNRFGPVKFTQAHMRAAVVDEERFHRVTGLQAYVGGRYRSVDEVFVRPGRLLRVRALLRDDDGRPSRRHFAIRMPRRGPGRGVLKVGASGSGSGGFCFLFGECSSGGGSADSFDALISKLENAPRNNELLATLRLSRRDGPVRRQQTARLDEVVRGSKSLRVFLTE